MAAATIDTIVAIIIAITITTITSTIAERAFVLLSHTPQEIDGVT